MIQLNPEFLKKNGKPEFVILPYEEFLLLQELLEDLEDSQDLRQAKMDEKDKPSISLTEAKEMLNLS
jgi:PHD/YefM family antitoxin component YafN of YafNO toxin-antitoxin module